MKITREIQDALRLAIEKAGTQELLSKKCGIPRSCFSNYLNNQVDDISHDHWLKLLPHLLPYLPIEVYAPDIQAEEIARQVRHLKYLQDKGHFTLHIERQNGVCYVDMHHKSGIFVQLSIPIEIEQEKLEYRTIMVPLHDLCQDLLEEIEKIPIPEEKD